MFGSDPSSIYQSAADQSLNNFQDPRSMAYMNQGWGVNPNYATPAYDAPYRPAYQGPGQYSANYRPSFGGALNQVFNPLYQDPYWGNPIDNNQGAMQSLATKPADAAVTVAQRFLAPALAFGLASKFTSGFGKGLGQGFLSGAAKGLGAGARVSGAAGTLGGMVGGFGIPLALGYAATEAINTTVFQPYVRSRQLGQTTQEAFRNVSFSGAQGNAVTGRGLSSEEASKLGSMIDKQGIKDLTFSANQYGGIATMGMNAGLFDDVQSKGISERVKSVASQIKMIVSISKDPNIQAAVEELSKLRAGGASISGGATSQAASTYSAIGMHASAAGTTVQRLMQTVGGQGQYLFQMNGLTPYLGQVAAASAYSGFSNAQRSGLIGSAQMARMGGLEGATQSALTAQLTASSTTFNRMGLVNRFMGGDRAGSSMVGTVSGFGGYASRNPLQTQGAMALYGGAMASAQMREEGSAAPEKQAIEILKSLGQKPDSNGKYSPELLAVAFKQMGMPDEQIQAYVAQRAAETDPESVKGQMAGFRAQTTEQLQAVMSRNRMNDTVWSRTGRSVAKGWKSVKAGIAGETGHAWSESVGRLTDTVERGLNEFMTGGAVGKTPGTGDLVYSEFETGKTNAIDMDKAAKAFAESRYEGTMEERKEKAQRGSNTQMDLAKALKEESKKTGAAGDLARELLQKGADHKDSPKLLAKFMATQKDPNIQKALQGLETSDKFSTKFLEGLKGMLVSADKGDPTRVAQVEKELSTLVSGNVGVTEKLQIVGQAQNVLAELQAGEGPDAIEIKDLLDKKENAALKASLKGATPEEMIQKITELNKRALGSGFRAAATNAAAAGQSVEEIMKDPRRFAQGNEKLMQEIRSAGTDKAKADRVITRELARRSGGSIQGQTVKLASDATREEILETGSAMDAGTKAVASAVTQSTSQVDYSQFTKATGALDKSAGVFSDAVRVFAETVNGMKGRGSPIDSRAGTYRDTSREKPTGE